MIHIFTWACNMSFFFFRVHLRFLSSLDFRNFTMMCQGIGAWLFYLHCGSLHPQIFTSYQIYRIFIYYFFKLFFIPTLLWYRKCSAYFFPKFLFFSDILQKEPRHTNTLPLSSIHGFCVCVCVCDTMLLICAGGPGSCDSPASAPSVLELWVHATIPGFPF